MKLDADGLVPVIVQDELTGEVRMLAYADERALDETRESKRATFFSRSRKARWVKGETSGHFVEVREVRLDCDEDAALYLGSPAGPTCHTGEETCFSGGSRAPLLLALEAELEARKSSTAQASYTKSLYEGGALRIGQKLREEADELARALDGEADSRVVSEAADVVYHLLVGLRHRNVALRDVLAELGRRSSQSGHAEKASRAPKPAT